MCSTPDEQLRRSSLTSPGWLLLLLHLSPSPTPRIKAAHFLSMFCLLMLFMITYARGQPRGPLHNTSILCTGWRVTAYMMCRHLHSLGHGPCPCLYLSENLSYCPLGAYPIPCKGARVKLLREWGDGPWTCYFMWLNALIAASKSIFRGGSGKAPHSPHPTPPQEVSGPKCGGEGTYWEKGSEGPSRQRNFGLAPSPEYRML